MTDDKIITKLIHKNATINNAAGYATVVKANYHNNQIK